MISTEHNSENSHNAAVRGKILQSTTSTHKGNYAIYAYTYCHYTLLKSLHSHKQSITYNIRYLLLANMKPSTSAFGLTMRNMNTAQESKCAHKQTPRVNKQICLLTN